jgi:putative ABC transport system permease protein
MSLTVGFACTCLLVSFLMAESSVDSFHSKKGNIFQLSSNDPFGGTGPIVFIIRPTANYLGNYPEVQAICLVSAIDKSEIEAGESFSPVKVVQVDTTFFSMFDFPREAGSAGKLTPDGLMISSTKAQQLFGTTDVIGRTVVFKTPDTTKTLVINGIISQAKEKSHIVFDAVISNEVFRVPQARNSPGGACYALLREPASNPEGLMAKVNNDSLMPALMGEGTGEYYLEPLQRSYFNTSNRMPFMNTRSEMFIRVGWIVCGLILLMASFNFINLFLLSMQERRKEQGIKKTLGISVFQTIKSLSLETSIYVAVSFVLSLGFVYTLIPVFNTTLETDLAFSYLSKFNVISYIGLSVFVLSMTAILFSVLQQKKVLPVSMMKNTTSKVRVSKIFFTLQFFVSITLCVCSITIIRQMNFIENEPLGFNRNILQLTLPSNGPEFKNRVLQIAGVDHATLAQGNPISGNMQVRYDLENGKFYTPYMFSGDEDFMETLKLQVVKGSLDIKNANGKFVNETFVKHFNMTDPVGMKIPGTKDDFIAGVVSDFTCSSFKQEIPPVIIAFEPQQKQLLIDYSGTDLVTLMPKVREAWDEMFAGEYFSYKVIQQDLMKKYSEETLFTRIVMASSITSMIISCFGLFALSWAVIKSRAKEMGIRKVLGASASDVLRLLTTSFAKRLAIAFALAAPAGYYLMELWLSRFVYKVPVSAWVFIASGVVLATITIVTLGIQTVKASFSSPLEEIRD